MIVAAVVLAAVCGGLLFGAVKVSDYLRTVDDLADAPGTPVPSPTIPAPPERGSETLVFGGLPELKRILEIRVVRTAGVVKPVTSTCDTEQVTATFHCEVTYQGEVVKYAVTTRDDAGGGGWSEWEAKPDSLVVTRAGVLAAVWRQHRPHATDLRCQQGIPERARVEPDTVLTSRCYFKPTESHPQYDDHPTTREVKIVIGDGDIFAPTTN